MSKMVCFLWVVLSLGCTKKQTIAHKSPLSKLPSAELTQLLKGVPNNADVVFSAALPRSLKDHSKEFLVQMTTQNFRDMEAELRLHFDKHQMNDFRNVRSVVGYLKKRGSKPGGALLLMMDKQAKVLKPSAGFIQHVVFASHQNILIVGDSESVETSIAELRGQKRSVASSAMIQLAEKHIPQSYFFAALSGSLLGSHNMPFSIGGFETAWLKMAPRQFTGEVKASESSITLLNTAIGFGVAQALAEASKKRQEQADKPWQGVGAIVGYFHVKDLLEKMTPKVDKNTLAFDVKMQEGYEKWAALVGIGAAAFAAKKYWSLSNLTDQKSQSLNF